MNEVSYFARRIVSVVALTMLVSAGWPPLGHAQPAGIDPQAEKLLRRMSDYLAGRQQFTVKGESMLEAVLTSGQRLQYDSPATLSVSRPNKLHAHRKGDLANQEFFYDGKSLTLYSPRENVYATTAAPATLDEMLDFAREKLDVIAPAGELLYTNAAEKNAEGVHFRVCRRPERRRGSEDHPSSVSRRGSRLADLDRRRRQAVAAQVHYQLEESDRRARVHGDHEKLGRSAEVHRSGIQF